MAEPTIAGPINPRQVKHIRVVCGETDFSAQVTKCLYQKGGGAVQTLQGGTPEAQYVDKAPAEHSVVLGVISDWEKDDSLCNYLYDHDGEKATLEYMPFAGGLVYFTSEITIDAPPPPGTIGEWPTIEVTMPSTKPVRAKKPVPGP